MAKSTRVKISKLKANLSAYLRRVRAGEEIVIEDRDTAIGTIRGIDTNDVPSIETRQPLESSDNIQKIKSPLKTPIPAGLLDQVLRDDRSRR